MLPLSVLKRIRAKYCTMETKDLEELLIQQKEQLKHEDLSKGMTKTLQKIKMIEEELKTRENMSICNL